MTKDEAYIQYKKLQDSDLPPKMMSEASENAFVFLGNILAWIRDREERAFKSGFLTGKEAEREDAKYRVGP